MKKVSVVILFFMILNSIHAQDLKPMADASDFLKKLKSTSQTTQSIHADFIEEKYLSYLKEPQKSTGVFYYKKENKMRWEKEKPAPYIFLVSGDKVKIKENDKEKDVSSFNQVIVKIKELMISLVNGQINENKAYKPAYFQTTEFYVIQLKPTNKKMANVFDYIQLNISKETMRLKELSFYEKSGDKSVMKFFNDKVNENLSDQLFTNF